QSTPAQVRHEVKDPVRSAPAYGDPDVLVRLARRVAAVAGARRRVRPGICRRDRLRSAVPIHSGGGGRSRRGDGAYRGRGDGHRQWHPDRAVRYPDADELRISRDVTDRTRRYADGDDIP